MKYFFTTFLFILSFAVCSQTALIPQSDPIPAKVVLYLPLATTQQITPLVTEFAKHPQITSAQYVSTHKCILIDLGVVDNPRFLFYADLVKIISQYIPYKEIKIKTPDVYEEIKSASDTGGIDIK